MHVADQITEAFFSAKQRFPDLDREWTTASITLGSRLPNSTLLMSIQREGAVDLVLRCMEDEQEVASPFCAHYKKMLSEYWIGGLYESLRLLRERKLLETAQSHSLLFADVELVRMVIDKHEIAKDKSFLDAPIELVRRPPNNDSSDVYVYDPKDPKRGHIPPVGLSQNGSIAWHVIDLRMNSSRWIARRAVSDLVLSLRGK
jgi:hypothetical protein